jgi:hypothetical protein
MEASRTKHVVLGGVGIIAVAVWVYGLTVPVAPRGRTTPAPGASVSASGSAGGAADRGAGAGGDAEREGRARSRVTGWGRNPFTLQPVRDLGELVLSGILWDATSPLAIINGRTVEVGDDIEGHRVAVIEPTGVILTDGTNTTRLSLGP